MALEKYLDFEPQIAQDTFTASSADIIGQVEIGSGSSIWYGAVLRGDMAVIKIGDNTSIQDNCTVHVAENLPTSIGNNVTVGHNAVLHGCIVEDNCLIGMGAVILDGAKIGKGSIIGAGAVIGEGKEIPPYSLAVGIPGQVVRNLDGKREQALIDHALSYKTLMKTYLDDK